MMSISEVLEYCRGNAIRAISICDDKYEGPKMDVGFVDICKFIAGDIKSDIELWGDQRRDMDNRRDSLLSAAERTRAEAYRGHEELLQRAQFHYEVIKGTKKYNES
jgi:hypothetical protein